MFKIEKICKILVVFVILASLTSVSAIASEVMLKASPIGTDSDDIAIDSFAEPITVVPGELFSINVFVSPDVEIAGMQFDMGFDDSDFQIVGIDEGKLFTQSGLSTFFVAGTYDTNTCDDVYGCILGSATVNSPSTFATITVKANDQANGPSAFTLEDVLISDAKGNAVEVDTSNTNVMVYDFDVDQNGIVDIDDYTIIQQHFGETTSYPYPPWDLNQDNTLNILDIILIMPYIN